MTARMGMAHRNMRIRRMGLDRCSVQYNPMMAAIRYLKLLNTLMPVLT